MQPPRLPSGLPPRADALVESHRVDVPVEHGPVHPSAITRFRFLRKAHHQCARHALTADSDFGTDRIWRFDTKLPDTAKPIADRLAYALAPLGIARGSATAEGGADIGPLVRAGVPVIDLQQDGTRYFDIHHTPDDTLDKVDPVQLRQNVAAWTAMLLITADAPEDLAAVPQK